LALFNLSWGVAFLFVSALFLETMGHFTPPPDLNYMLGMLAARFLAYGIGMFFVTRAPEQNIFWINNMILIQVIDLAVGLYYTTTGTVSLAMSAFPMFNASAFIILLLMWRPRRVEQLSS